MHAHTLQAYITIACTLILGHFWPEKQVFYLLWPNHNAFAMHLTFRSDVSAAALFSLFYVRFGMQSILHMRMIQGHRKQICVGRLMATWISYLL